MAVYAAYLGVLVPKPVLRLARAAHRLYLARKA